VAPPFLLVAGIMSFASNTLLAITLIGLAVLLKLFGGRIANLFCGSG